MSAWFRSFYSVHKSKTMALVALEAYPYGVKAKDEREEADSPSLGHGGWGLLFMGSRQIAHARTPWGGCELGSCPGAHNSVLPKVWSMSFQMFLEHIRNILQLWIPWEGSPPSFNCPSIFLIAPKNKLHLVAIMSIMLLSLEKSQLSGSDPLAGKNLIHYFTLNVFIYM